MAEPNEIASWSRRVQRFLVFLSLLCITGAFLRVILSAKDWSERLDTTTLIYLGVAGALLLVRDLKSFGIGEFKLEFIERLQQAEQAAAAAQATAKTAQETVKTVQATAETAQATANVAQSAALLGIGGPGFPNAAGLSDAVDAKPAAPPAPPQARNRALQARIGVVPGRTALFAVNLRVVSTQPENDPLRGTVEFFLHPTFHSDRAVVPVGADGVAELNLVAWGAFPVSAIADEGKTRLGLDLAALADAPAAFRNC